MRSINLRIVRRRRWRDCVALALPPPPPMRRLGCSQIACSNANLFGGGGGGGGVGAGLVPGAAAVVCYNIRASNVYVTCV